MLAAPAAPNAAVTVQECEAARSSATVFLDPIKWPTKAQFLHMLWEKPATQIAAELGCCQASALMRAKELDLPRPGHGYWQKKPAGIATAVRDDVGILMAKLDADSFVNQLPARTAAASNLRINGTPASACQLLGLQRHGCCFSCGQNRPLPSPVIWDAPMAPS